MIIVLFTVSYKIIIYLFTVIGLSPGGSGYFTVKQNMKLVTTEFKSGGLHEKHVVATWNLFYSVLRHSLRGVAAHQLRTTGIPCSLSLPHLSLSHNHTLTKNTVHSAFTV